MSFTIRTGDRRSRDGQVQRTRRTAAAAIPFAISGVPIACSPRAGLDLAVSRNLTLGISYAGQLGSNVHDHGAKGRLIWRF